MSGNGLSPLYITGVDLNQYFVSNQTGEALANGKIYFYVDSNRTQAKQVFQLVQGSGNPPNYTYLPLPNPITLSAVGTIIDANGNNCALFYYPYDSYGNVQLYYIECYDQYNNLQFTREAWPYLSTTGGGMSGTINSAGQNSVAWYATTGTTISGIPPVNSSVFVTSNTGIPGWTQTLPSQVQVTVNSLNSGTGASSSTYFRGDGTWAATNTSPDWHQIGSVSLSGTASPVTFTQAAIVNYTNLVIELANVQVSTNCHLSLGVSVNGGSDYNSGSGAIYIVNGTGATLSDLHTSSSSPVQIDTGTGTAGTSATYGVIIITNPTPSGVTKYVDGMYYQPAFGAGETFTLSGIFQPMNQINAVGLFLSAGNFASGTINLWGY